LIPPILIVEVGRPGMEMDTLGTVMLRLGIERLPDGKLSVGIDMLPDGMLMLMLGMEMLPDGMPMLGIETVGMVMTGTVGGTSEMGETEGGEILIVMELWRLMGREVE
jgi:hypothetical protein